LENIFAWLESLTGKNCFKKLVIRTETGLQLKNDDFMVHNLHPPK